MVEIVKNLIILLEEVLLRKGKKDYCWWSDKLSKWVDQF